MKMTKTLSLIPFIALLAGSVSGCDMANFAAGSTVKVIARGAPAIQRFEDAETAEAAIPGSIGTMEAVLEIRPTDTLLRTVLARSYASYGFGFLSDRMEVAESVDDIDTADHLRGRATIAFRRGRDLALGNLSVWEDDNGGVDGAISRGPDAFTAYLKKFDDAEEHVPSLFWAAYSWAQYIGINKDDMDAISGLPYVYALVDRVLELDSTYMNHAPKAVRAGLLAGMPAALGGKPEEAKQLFEAAIEATGRKNLMYMVMEAKYVAIALLDRTLYRTLLEEVINAGDVDPDNRLSNVLAKRRAVRYLAQIDNYFEPEGTFDAPEESEATTTEDTTPE